MAGRGNIKPSVKNRLFATSAGRCNMCGESVVDSANKTAEIAHIVGVGGEFSPRSSDRTLNDCDINDYGNLILLCRNCHSIIDHPSNKDRYTTNKLLDMKRDFEKKIADSLLINIRVRNFFINLFYNARLGHLYMMVKELPYKYKKYFLDIEGCYEEILGLYPGVLPFENIGLQEAFDSFNRSYNLLDGKLNDKSSGYNYYPISLPDYKLHVDDEDNRDKIERDISDSKYELLNAWCGLCKEIESAYPNFPFHNSFPFL